MTSFSRFENSRNVEVPLRILKSSKRFEHSEAVERLERFERSSLLRFQCDRAEDLAGLRATFRGVAGSFVAAILSVCSKDNETGIKRK